MHILICSNNRYDLRLFKEIRWTKKISIFPVGLIGYTQGVSFPIIANKADKASSHDTFNAQNRNDCEVIGFSDAWWGNRKYPVDMAGFAVNVDFLSSRPSHEMPFRVTKEEDGFFERIWKKHVRYFDRRLPELVGGVFRDAGRCNFKNGFE